MSSFAGLILSWLGGIHACTLVRFQTRREYRSLFAFYEPGANPYFSPALVAPGRRVHDCGLEMRPTEALYDEASRHSFAGRAAIRRFFEPGPSRVEVN